MGRLRLTASGLGDMADAILRYLEANVSEPLAERINAGKKTIKGCVNYLNHKALEKIEKSKRTGVAVSQISDKDVYGMAVHYFEEDSLDYENRPCEAAMAYKAAASGRSSSSPVKARGGNAAVASVDIDDTAANAKADELIAKLGLGGNTAKTAPAPAPKHKAEEPEKKKDEGLDLFKALGIEF